MHKRIFVVLVFCFYRRGGGFFCRREIFSERKVATEIEFNQ